MTTHAVRHGYLTTLQLYELDRACEPIREALDTPYLVGSADSRADFRDVDVRVMLDDDAFDALFADRPHLWTLMCMTLSVYLRERTGLPVDFQIQRLSVANERYGDCHRNPLGLRLRDFAGGGDGTRKVAP